MKNTSLENIERVKGVKAPYEYAVSSITETAPFLAPQGDRGVISLNGVYEMTEGGSDIPSFDHTVKANVPCTVQTALYEAGIIPDPMYAKNDKLAREAAYKTWWFKHEFNYDGTLKEPHLYFCGVCYHAHFYLNGVYLGEHKGMFGGPDFAIGDILKPRNTLIVKIENSPTDIKHYSEYADFDEGWKYGTVVNCVYGWHYACIPTRGIWADVCLIDKNCMRFKRPFIFTKDFKTGELGISLKAEAIAEGEIMITVTPRNFAGESQYFKAPFSAKKDGYLNYVIKIKAARLWWPSGYGEQPLYDVNIRAVFGDGVVYAYDDTVGIRQIEMLPIEGLDPAENYNWQFAVNGEKIFIKGTNWCTTDALLRCDAKRYDRFLTLAKEQNLQLLRAWGGGMPESDYFYKKCDELGLLVQQEWPTCWDSPKTQPFDELTETVYCNTVRIRNHPSLIRWAGGNELSAVDEPSIKKMAELSVTLDGTRPFHKTSPYAGSLHNYDTYWMMQDMDNAINLRAPFIGEFGMASCPNVQSVARYVPPEELTLPISRDEKTAFNYHTPRFNEFLWPEQYNDMDHLLMRSKEFFDIKTLDDFILGTQLAQGVAICHTLEAARSDFPKAAGICYYKLTDVYPACSWSTVDYYGVPKIPYYMIKRAYKPAHAMLLIKSIDAAKDYPVFLLDDLCEYAGKNCTVRVTAFGANLEELKTEEYKIIPNGKVNRFGDFTLENEAVKNVRLLEVRLYADGVLADGTFYFQNYKQDTGCYKRLPETSVDITVEGSVAVLKNTGDVPAVGVFVECLSDDSDFTASDNFIMLGAGEVRKIGVNRDSGLTVRGLNI